MNELTLRELMGEDMSLFAKLIDRKHVHVEVVDENDKEVYAETSHIYAWDSLVTLAHQIIRYDERIQQNLIRIEDASKG